MMTNDKNWVLKNVNIENVESLYQSLKIHPALCNLLVLREITNYEDAKNFFRPKLEHVIDPFLMKNMDVAVERIVTAIKDNQQILIYGDYDVDGTTAVSVVFSFLRDVLKAENVHYYIPHRYKEGYGISRKGIEYAQSINCQLIIALDCGIKAIEMIDYANQFNIDVIVCDHHLPGEILPNAYAILNPKQKDCTYPFKELSGCGIGFKLINALAKILQLPEDSVHTYLDLVATSIAADIVPMNGENRILAYYGLLKANEHPCAALKALKDISGVNRRLTISDLVFIIAPRINAAGRMDDAGKVIELFTEKNIEKVKLLAESLQTDNLDRKIVDKHITDEALSLLGQEEGLTEKVSTVLFKEHWHKGVVGIVASRLIEHYYRPTVVLTESNGKITGSARSVNGFNIYEAIHKCRDLLDNYGGHYFAAGLTFPKNNLDAFKEKFENEVIKVMGPKPLIPEILIDAEINFTDITDRFFNIIKQFEPFGPTNLRPVFITKKVQNVSSKIVKDMHVRFIVKQEQGFVFTGIGFGLAKKFDIVVSGLPFDMVYTIEENEWNGMKTLQMKVCDIMLSSENY